MIAVIAGTGQLPIVTCRVLRMARKPFFVVALFPEDNRQALEQELGPDIPLLFQDFFKPSAILALLKEHKATQILMIGKVDKMRLLKKVSFDAMALRLLGSMVNKSDVSLMERIVAEFGNHGFEVVRQDQVLADLLVSPGVLTGTMTPELQDTITVGIQAAIAMSAAHIGQTVVAKDKMVLAVEAIEGTDACIARGISLGHGGVVVCKAAHDAHNNKFDLPTLGVASMAHLQPGQVQAIAWRSTHTLIIDRQAFIQRATQLGITLVSV